MLNMSGWIFNYMNEYKIWHSFQTTMFKSEIIQEFGLCELFLAKQTHKYTHTQSSFQPLVAKNARAKVQSHLISRILTGSIPVAQS